jgi:hypothetical protein
VKKSNKERAAVKCPDLENAPADLLNRKKARIELRFWD